MQNAHRGFLLFDTWVSIFLTRLRSAEGLGEKRSRRFRALVAITLLRCVFPVSFFCAAFAREYRARNYVSLRAWRSPSIYICPGIERNPIARMRKTRPTSLFSASRFAPHAIYGTSPSIVRHLRSDWMIARRDHSIDFPLYLDQSGELVTRLCEKIAERFMHSCDCKIFFSRSKGWMWQSVET